MDDERTSLVKPGQRNRRSQVATAHANITHFGTLCREAGPTSRPYAPGRASGGNPLGKTGVNVWVEGVASEAGVEMMRGARVCVAILAAATVGLAVWSAVGSGAPIVWACQHDHIALDLFTYGQGGGSATAEEALRSEAGVLASDGVSDQSRLNEALASRSGPTRYAPSTGMVYIDGSVVAQISPGQLPDKSWVVESARYCSPPA